MASSTAPRNAQEARDNFVAWLRIYMRTQKITTDLDLAARLGVSRARISQLFKPGATTEPGLELLLAARRVTGYAIDVLLSTPPPTP